ncbi:MAG: peptide deformylase [Candidatus Kerfeldbacteria bacterium]|nr:peptide deformylase [Candidatus Kerfeldbacteria bacterium]
MPKKLLIHTVDKNIEVRTQCAEIQHPETSVRTPEMQEFFDQLIEAMIRYNGIGIAAPQVGHCVRICVIHKEYTETPDHLILINPRIVSLSERTFRLEQGCLSVPGTYGPVVRPAKIRVKAYTRNGTPIDIKAKGMYAQVLQHEIDHLDGILFIDKAEYVDSKA